MSLGHMCYLLKHYIQVCICRQRMCRLWFMLPWYVLCVSGSVRASLATVVAAKAKPLFAFDWSRSSMRILALCPGGCRQRVP